MERKEIIKKIEDINDSKVLCYITNDSSVFNGQIGRDIYPFLYDALETIGEVNRIDLFLFSHGGDTLVPWKFVNLIREYSKEFNVLIPFHANSAATLISLGANHIYMSKLANIGPIDPTLTTPFNPSKDPNNLNSPKLGVSVEDVVGYYELAKNIMDLKSENSILKIYEILSQNVNPIALGAIYRSYNQIRSIARKLLELHMDSKKDALLIDRIIGVLTERLYNHSHTICRNEAKSILGDNIVQYPNKELETLIMDLYKNIKNDIHLNDTRNLLQMSVPLSNGKIVVGTHALIETYDVKYEYKSEKKWIQNQNGEYRVEDVAIGWQKSQTGGE